MLKQFYDDILSGRITIKQSKDEQNEINEEISDLEDYKPANRNKIKKSLRFMKMQEIFWIKEKRLLRHFKKLFF